MKCFGEKPKTFHCKVVLLDETELIQEIQVRTFIDLGQSVYCAASWMTEMVAELPCVPKVGCERQKQCFNLRNAFETAATPSFKRFGVSTDFDYGFIYFKNLFRSNDSERLARCHATCVEISEVLSEKNARAYPRFPSNRVC